MLLRCSLPRWQVSDEFKQVISTLKGHDDKVRVVLNKADQVDMQQLMRVYGALMWSLGKVFRSPEARPAVPLATPPHKVCSADDRSRGYAGMGLVSCVYLESFFGSPQSWFYFLFLMTLLIWSNATQLTRQLWARAHLLLSKVAQCLFRGRCMLPRNALSSKPHLQSRQYHC